MTSVNTLSGESTGDFGGPVGAITHHADLRCLACNKLLAKTNNSGVVAGEIKCPRCGVINEK